MSLGKRDIIKSISSEAQISATESYNLLKVFLNLLKENKDLNIKISNFGTFSPHITPRRFGRNPKTKEVFEIKPRKIVTFKPSNKVKRFLN